VKIQERGEVPGTRPYNKKKQKSGRGKSPDFQLKNRGILTIEPYGMGESRWSSKFGGRVPSPGRNLLKSKKNKRSVKRKGGNWTLG